MGFNKRKMEDARRQKAENEAAARLAIERQVLEDAEQLVIAWNERQAKRMPMLFSPTIGAAITAGYWFLRARCPACRLTGGVDLRALDWHRGAAATRWRRDRLGVASLHCCGDCPNEGGKPDRLVLIGNRSSYSPPFLAVGGKSRPGVISTRSGRL